MIDTKYGYKSGNTWKMLNSDTRLGDIPTDAKFYRAELLTEIADQQTFSFQPGKSRYYTLEPGNTLWYSTPFQGLVEADRRPLITLVQEVETQDRFFVEVHPGTHVYVACSLGEAISALSDT